MRSIKGLMFQPLSFRNYSTEYQKKILNSFSLPKDMIERSFFQYKCQTYSQRRLHIFFLNLISLLLIFVSIPFFIFKYSLINKKHEINKKKTAVFPFKEQYENIMPEELKREFSIKEISFNKSNVLNLFDLKFIFKIWSKHLFCFHFLLKIIVKIGFYRYMMSTNDIKAIIVASEYSYTSSVLTWFCRKNGIAHINIMHGEKMINMRDSFFQFDRCYVWDKHYIHIFSQLRAELNQFIISSPNPLDFNMPIVYTYKYFATYYLGNENFSEFIKIKEMLTELDIPKQKLCIRFHPRYTNFEIAKKIFSDFSFEFPNKVSIKDSFKNTERIISFFSTVLYSGHINGKTIILDDVVHSKNDYNDLKKADYIIFSKPFLWLSDILKEQK